MLIAFLINAGLRILPVQMLAATGKAKLNAYCAAFTAIFHAISFNLVITELNLEAGAILTGIIYLISAALSWVLLLHNRNVIKKGEICITKK
jgi:O-antigen/teichoic acid export membrane protein